MIEYTDEMHAMASAFEAEGGESLARARAIVSMIDQWVDLGEHEPYSERTTTAFVSMRDIARQLTDSALLWIWVQCTPPGSPMTTVRTAHQLAAGALIRLHQATKPQEGGA